MSLENFFEKYASYFSLGLEIAAGIALPILLGYWLDVQFKTLPWLTIAGAAVGIINIFLLITRIKNSVDDEGE